MNKKGIIAGIIVVVLLIAIIVGIVIGEKSRKESEKGITQLITLDINPSFELDVQDGKANRINPDGDEAWELINRDFEGKPLEEVLNEIVKNAKEKGYEDDGKLTIILGMEEKDKRIEDKLKEACEKNDVTFDIIVPEITEEAKREAVAYKVTPAKAAVILEAMEGLENAHFDDWKDKSARELNEIKETGLYCDPEYTLHGDVCEKVVKEEKAKEGKKCPANFQEINGKCYKVGATKHEPSCKKGYELKDGKCIGTDTVDAKPICSEGTYNSKSKKCEKQEVAGDGVKSCKNNEPPDRMMSNGRCSGAKWAHDDGTCEGNDKFIEDNSGGPNAGWCYTPTGDYDAIIICPKGQTAKDGKCYTVGYSVPTYTCDKGSLSGDKCEVETTKQPTLKVACDSGLTNYKDRACIDYNVTEDHITGLTCDGSARLEGDKCVYYETVEPHGK